jgi:hypothetical protein
VPEDEPGTAALALTGRLVGHTEARLHTAPLRPLTRATSLGYEVCDFADQVLGEPLLPWQRWLAIHALELNEDGLPRFRTVVCLVARQNGKTNLSRTLALWQLFMRNARNVIGAAQDLSIAREVLALAASTVDGIDELRQERACRETYIRANGRELLPLISGAQYLIKASNGSAGRGLTADHLTMDEIRQQRDWRAWASLSKTTRARPMAQIWCLSNAGDDESVVLNQLRTAAGVVHGEDGQETVGPASDDTIGLFEWSAPAGCELDDEDGWCAANPALGYLISERVIRSDLGTDPVDVFRTEVLCQHVEKIDGAVDLSAWRAGADAGSTLAALRSRIALCVDVSPDEKHVTAVAGAQTEDGRFRLEVVGSWRDVESARRELPGLVAAIAPFRIAWFPAGPVKPLRAELRTLGTTDDTRILYQLDPETIELSGSEAAEACVSLASLVRSGRIIHSDDPLLNAHVAATRKLPSGESWRFVRLGSAHIDAAYAAAGVVQALRTAPPQRKVASFAY